MECCVQQRNPGTTEQRDLAEPPLNKMAPGSNFQPKLFYSSQDALPVETVISNPFKLASDLYHVYVTCSYSIFALHKFNE